jgi:hypothetical protein
MKKPLGGDFMVFVPRTSAWNDVPFSASVWTNLPATTGLLPLPNSMAFYIIREVKKPPPLVTSLSPRARRRIFRRSIYGTKTGNWAASKNRKNNGICFWGKEHFMDWKG